MTKGVIHVVIGESMQWLTVKAERNMIMETPFVKANWEYKVQLSESLDVVDI